MNEERGQAPWEVLGVDREASPEQVRAAYLALVKKFPPDNAPEQFEKIRDAYEHFRDFRKRMTAILEGGDQFGPLMALLEGAAGHRVAVGPKPWLEALMGETPKR